MADIFVENFESDIEAILKKRFEQTCKDRYAWALRMAGVEEPQPTWEELSEEQRENVRKEVRRYDQEMRALGDQISKGTATTAAVIASNL